MALRMVIKVDSLTSGESTLPFQKQNSIHWDMHSISDNLKFDLVVHMASGMVAKGGHRVRSTGREPTVDFHLCVMHSQSFEGSMLKVCMRMRMTLTMIRERGTQPGRD